MHHRAENHLHFIAQKTIFILCQCMHTLETLAVLLTLAPFYPPGNTKTSQKWLLLVIFIKMFFSESEKTSVVGGIIHKKIWEGRGNGSFLAVTNRKKKRACVPHSAKNSWIVSEDRPQQKVVLIGNDGADTLWADGWMT